MIKIEKTEVVGWEAAIRGMRNPMNSWDKSDSFILKGDAVLDVGEADHKLMTKLAKGGPVHAKYRRMINVYCDITAPLYWWKEFDTYKVGTVANSCSTMHKIADKAFVYEDFSCEHLFSYDPEKSDGEQEFVIYLATEGYEVFPMDILADIIYVLNECRAKYLETKDKRYWWQMIQLLPTSYNQKRTVMLNYEVLHNIYISRKDHKLDEWHDFCDWIKELPESDLITGEE